MTRELATPVLSRVRARIVLASVELEGWWWWLRVASCWERAIEAAIDWRAAVFLAAEMDAGLAAKVIVLAGLLGVRLEMALLLVVLVLVLAKDIWVGEEEEDVGELELELSSEMVGECDWLVYVKELLLVLGLLRCC